jgi:hypothetical protein
MSSTDFGLFDTVIGGPAAVPYAVAWSLVAVGTVFATIVEKSQVFVAGGRPNIGKVVVQSATAALALVLFVPISKGVWWATQSVAYSIYPDTAFQGLGRALTAIGRRFQSYSFSFSVTNVVQGIKDSLVSVSALSAYAKALLAHYQLKEIQSGVYNVVFVFGPLLIGLSAFGLPTLRIWITALLEVSSWSITCSVLYLGITTQLQNYMKGPVEADPSLFSSTFLDAMNSLSFLASLMIVVPIVTARLLGMQALGELGRVMPGSTWAGRLGRWVGSFQTYGPQIDPSLQSQSPPTRRYSAPAQRRPGD